MSTLNLRSPDLAAAYQAVLSGDPKTNWALFSYSGNDLKVAGTGDGGLEEIEDEFSDGKIQYAFVRVVDPNVGAQCIFIISELIMNVPSQSKLNKFVQINWLGEAVPESKRGMISEHSAPTAHIPRTLMSSCHRLAFQHNLAVPQRCSCSGIG